MEEVMDYKFDSIEEIIEEIRAGHIVIMQDPSPEKMKAIIFAPQNLLLRKM